MLTKLVDDVFIEAENIMGKLSLSFGRVPKRGSSNWLFAFMALRLVIIFNLNGTSFESVSQKNLLLRQLIPNSRLFAQI